MYLCARFSLRTSARVHIETDICGLGDWNLINRYILNVPMSVVFDLPISRLPR